MLAIITCDAFVLLEYNVSLDGYEVSEDEGRSYPYELYEDITILNEEAYLIYLDERAQVPTSKHDLWLPIEAALSHLSTYQSKTDAGQALTNRLYQVLKDYSEHY